MSTKLVRSLAPLVLSLPLGACEQSPVVWNDDAERRALVPPPPPSSTGASLDLRAVADSTLRTTLRAAMHVADASAPPAGVSPNVLNARGPACAATVRVAAGRGTERDAVWWSLRPNGTALLVASRSPDAGQSWSDPVPVDTLDVARTGCDRPAPAIAVDSVNGYVHVAYAITAPDGIGVFYAHRMGPTLPFEPPHVIVYGDRMTPASVASDRDMVAVAYEDPNTGGRPYVSLALSRTAGHTWDERFAVSSDVETAERPGVALRGHDVAVGWMVPNTTRQAATLDESPADANAGGVVVVRVGRVR
jgi:hypothetical protein